MLVGLITTSGCTNFCILNLFLNGSLMLLSDGEEPQLVSLILWCVVALRPCFWVLLDQTQKLVLSKILYVL